MQIPEYGILQADSAGRCNGFDPADGFTGREAHFSSGYRFSPMKYR
jgi:hypothetical protein